MAEFASKGVAGTALGLGIAGTVGLASQLTGNGGLGGLFGGGNNQEVVDLKAQVAKLESEKYTDDVAMSAYKQSVADNKSLRDDVFAYVNPIAQTIASNQTEIAVLKQQFADKAETDRLREQLTHAKINEVALVANNGLTALGGQVACLQNTVSNITKVYVPAASVTPAPMPEFNSWTAPTATTTTAG
jgi:hypothetical protein